MKDLFDDQTVPIQCPNCGHKTPKSVAWLKRHSRFVCPCGTIVEIATGQFGKEISRIDLVLESLKRKMESIGKN